MINKKFGSYILNLFLKLNNNKVGFITCPFHSTFNKDKFKLYICLDCEKYQVNKKDICLNCFGEDVIEYGPSWLDKRRNQ